MKNNKHKQNISKTKNPVCAVWWMDAAYVFQNTLPDHTPPPNVTVGFVVEANDDFTHIVTDAAYNQESGAIGPHQGVLIPKKSIIEFKLIGNLHDKE